MTSDGDEHTAHLRGVLMALAVTVRASSTCETCGCLLRPAEACPSCFPSLWRDRATARRRRQVRPGGIRTVTAPPGEYRDKPLRNFARTA